jgi:cyclophilin family peptidyl-prolyl cis-trans isomerase
MHRAAKRSILMIGVLALAGAIPLTAAAQDEEPSGDDTTAVQESAAPAEGAALDRVTLSVSVVDETGKPTVLGDIVIELYPQDAPKHVANFLKLVREGFYDGTTFHRIVPGFIVQGGDPISKSDWRSPKVGTGGATNAIPAEIGRKHVRGAVAAARLGDSLNPEKKSNGSQFYICLADLPALDRNGYSVFGQVVEGMDTVDKIARVKNAGLENGNRALRKVVITKAKVTKP